MREFEIRTTAPDFVLLNLLVLNLQSAQISLFIEIEIILELFPIKIFFIQIFRSSVSSITKICIIERDAEIFIITIIE